MSDPMTAGEELLQAERHDKRIRAEVLAACRAKVNVRIHNAQCSGLPGDIQDVSLLSLVRQDLEQLQPAAKDLEELLEEARQQEREKERKEALLDVLAFNSGLGCTPQEGYRDLGEALRDTKRLSVEKARAEGKG